MDKVTKRVKLSKKSRSPDFFLIFCDSKSNLKYLLRLILN